MIEIKDETITVIHKFDNIHQEMCKSNIINEKIADLSNILAGRNIYHIVLYSDEYKYHIRLLDDTPSVIYRNEDKKEWHYAVYDYDYKNDEIIEYNDYVIQDKNDKISIIDFITIWLKCGENVKNNIEEEYNADWEMWDRWEEI